MTLLEQCQKSVQEHPYYWALAKRLTEQTKCFHCGAKLEEALILPKEKEGQGINISAIHAFHLYSVHGLPPECLNDFVIEALQKEYDRI